ncbi:UPF0702 transmembrane protein YrbG [Lentibacillus sp. JNUCC-1]|uniref:DUF421 domain-containing protein n=1 Tax=Lentibacillus sp. JNUCC-1 TaxID=2654513 RepID=UPI0012E7D22C|nr:DUF421 domain-containing protein [Lentibacillus sp. JNUCC-1]MUV36311.1 UPF0702 transmembrane protein YrbG [Lentibacillus sp. JNUCC-1]
MPDWLMVISRSLILLVILFFLTKWLGKKQLSNMSIFEYISGIVLGGIVAIHSFDTDANIIHAVLAMLVWFFVPFTVDYLALKNKRLRDFTQGKSTILIQDGKIMEDNLKKEGFSADDLLQSLRRKDMFNAADVEFALLEPSGTVSVLPKKEAQAPTTKDLQMNLAPEKQPEAVIMDGEMLLEPLANLSLSVNWLETELDKMNVSIENVYLAQADTDGQLTVDLYDDMISVPQPTEKPLLLATLKKCQADLELFALETNNPDSKQLYERNSKNVQTAIDLLEPYLH